MTDIPAVQFFWADFAVLVGFWFLIAFACAIIASNKGRSAPLWFIIGALTAAIGLVVIAALPSERRTNDANATRRRCPFCAEDVQAAAIVCKHCGRDIPKIDRDAAEATQADEPLIVAINDGSWGTAFSLLNGGANPNARDRSGRTALEIARSRGDEQIASLLISKGASS